MRKTLWHLLSVAALLLSGCSTMIPAIEAVSPTRDFPGVSALGQNTNDDTRRRLTAPEFIDFLYARGPIPDPKDPTKMLPEKGPAVCFSSVDYQKNETAIADLCIKGKCTYEQKKAVARMQKFRADTAFKGKK